MMTRDPDAVRAIYQRRWGNINNEFEKDIPAEKSDVYSLPRTNITNFVSRKQKYNSKNNKTRKTKKSRRSKS